MNLSKIESVRVEQTVMGRLIAFGSIIVTGTGATKDPILFIADQISFRQAIQNWIKFVPGSTCAIMYLSRISCSRKALASRILEKDFDEASLERELAAAPAS